MALSAIMVDKKRSGMRVFKTRMFGRWAEKEGVSDAALLAAVDEMS